MCRMCVVYIYVYVYMMERASRLLGHKAVRDASREDFKFSVRLQSKRDLNS